LASYDLCNDRLEITVQKKTYRSQYNGEDPTEKKNEIAYNPDPLHGMESA